MRIVLDTNVLVSALLSKDGPPGQVLRTIKQERHTLVSSPYLTDELRAVCWRDHLRDRIAPEEVQDLIYNLKAVGVVVSDLPETHLSADPKDNPILATAIAGKANLIVTGDKSHMQSLGQMRKRNVRRTRLSESDHLIVVTGGNQAGK